jgi:hypothetical protein
MPRISAFYGLSIYMYYNDHEPAHFHVRYGEYQARISLTPSSLIDGRLPRRALAMVLEWAAERHNQLTENWELPRARRPLEPVEALE